MAVEVETKTERKSSAITLQHFISTMTSLLDLDKGCEGLRRIPLYLPLLNNNKPSPPSTLKSIKVYSEEWWESLEWDYPNAKRCPSTLL